MALMHEAQTPEERRLAEIYRAASTEEPPGHLDANIRAAARPSTPKGTRLRTPWWTPWRLPFAVAAVAVMSGTLALLVYEERGVEKEGVAESRAFVPPAVQPPPEATSQIAPAERARPAQKPLERERRDESITAAERASPEPAAPAMRPPEAALERVPDAKPTPGLRGFAGPAPLSAPAPAASNQAAQAKSEARVASDAIGSLTAELEAAPAARWIERIQTLRREGRTGDAEALIIEFRRRFPNDAMPPLP